VSASTRRRSLPQSMPVWSLRGYSNTKSPRSCGPAQVRMTIVGLTYVAEEWSVDIYAPLDYTVFLPPGLYG
jgi:hypothetical protein